MRILSTAANSKVCDAFSIRQLAPIALAGMALAAMQGCSSTQSSSKLGRSEVAPPPPQQAWRPPSGYEADGPRSTATYRGGRDPVTGRAQEWPPAAPVQSATMAPLPPAQPYQPARPSAQRSPYAHSPAALPQPGYAQQPPYAQQQQAYAPYGQPPYAQQGYGQSAPLAAGGSVEVRPGDTLYRIARANNVSVPSLMQANGLVNESIKPGQRLTIPAR